VQRGLGMYLERLGHSSLSRPDVPAQVPPVTYAAAMQRRDHWRKPYWLRAFDVSLVETELWYEPVTFLKRA
jgi:hypothetical protein